MRLMSLIPALWRRHRKASLVYVVNFRTAKTKEDHELNWKESNERDMWED